MAGRYTTLSLASCFINLIRPHLLNPIGCPFYTMPLGMSCALAWFTSMASRSYFITATTSAREAINLRADHHSQSPSTHRCQPHPNLIRALIFSCYLQRKAGSGITLYCKAQASDARLACLLNTLQCPAHKNRDDEIR